MKTEAANHLYLENFLDSVVVKLCFKLTMMPVVTAIPRPQYVLGTISPYPTLRNVIAMSHMAFRRLACSSSWYLGHKEKKRAKHVYRQHRIGTLVLF